MTAKIQWANVFEEVPIQNTNADADIGQHEHNWKLTVDAGSVSVQCSECDEYVDDPSLVYGTLNVNVKWHTKTYNTPNGTEYDCWVEIS
jgi:hypothetical protein